MRVFTRCAGRGITVAALHVARSTPVDPSRRRPPARLTSDSSAFMRDAAASFASTACGGAASRESGHEAMNSTVPGPKRFIPSNIVVPIDGVCTIPNPTSCFPLVRVSGSGRESNAVVAVGRGEANRSNTHKSVRSPCDSITCPSHQAAVWRGPCDARGHQPALAARQLSSFARRTASTHPKKFRMHGTRRR